MRAVRVIIWTALTGLGLTAAPAHADLRSKLRAGEIVATSVGGSGIVPGRAMGMVRAPAERVFEILTNIKNYAQFVPRIKGSKQLSRDRYELLAQLPWPIRDARVEVSYKSGRRGKTFVLSWKMLTGTLDKYEGAAWIQPWGADRCLLTYQTLAVPNIPAPSALMNRGLRNAVKKMVRAVRDRAAGKLALR